MTYKDRKKLQELYYERNKSCPEIAEMFGVSDKTIQYWMDKFDLPLRSRGEARSLWWKKEPPNISTGSNGYERFAVQSDKEDFVVLHHRLLAVAKYGFENVVEKVIHHKNNVRWDNRPENITVMTEEKHSRLHGIEEEQNRQRDTNGRFV